QGPSRPEQDHQEDAENAEHGKYRLLEQDADHAGPEPGRFAFDPGAEGGLARLVHVVPELAELGEPQGLVGHPARAVIDHEDESAGKKKQSTQSEKPADHAPPLLIPASARLRAYRGICGNSTSSVPYHPFATGLSGLSGVLKR